MNISDSIRYIGVDDLFYIEDDKIIEYIIDFFDLEGNTND